MSIEDDRKVIAKAGDVLECIYVEPAYGGLFTIGKKYIVLALVDNKHSSMIDNCLAFEMIGEDRDGTAWNPPRRMFRGRNVFGCKHNCPTCKEKCGLWESV